MHRVIPDVRQFKYAVERQLALNVEIPADGVGISHVRIEESNALPEEGTEPQGGSRWLRDSCGKGITQRGVGSDHAVQRSHDGRRRAKTRLI